ncbi:hypothetical protein EXE49_09275 [Halorubrum sp. ASP121]|uniref:type I restriction enzyme HsdR N-terminal domain-containing protein n=1 Tax=Halorubrum sp. ASP121 TaxID=1855858 RepID=UPI0010F531F6|nr:type I restriction enzyme HsdR N-terminal domain-containing protein [Halorubrum sp. ASP121]TKX49973.1 hypothetical protein EXE49_09275 [Halorubrum sp. ASP121]
MTIDDVENYVEQSTTVLSSTTNLDEQTTRTKLIDPFIRLLGWDLFSGDVELEYSVSMMSSNKQVDYALEIDGEPEVFLEAKAGKSSITDHHIGQLGDYMQSEWVELGLITNGRQFIALNLEPGEGGPPEIVELGNVGIEELPDNQWLVDLLSRDAVEAGDAHDLASNIAKREEALQHLRNNREAISRELADVVGRDLSEVIYQESTELAEDFIDDLIRKIENGKPVSEEPSSDPQPTKEISDNLVRPPETANQKISRNQLPGKPDDLVAVVPGKIERGLDFLFRNQAWGFVQIGKNPEYIAFYITGGDGVSAVWYVARVANVVEIDEANLEDDPSDIIDLSDPKERKKKVIELEPESLYELEDPIPYSKKYPMSLRYTRLEKLRTAETTEDLF